MGIELNNKELITCFVKNLSEEKYRIKLSSPDIAILLFIDQQFTYEPAVARYYDLY